MKVLFLDIDGVLNSAEPDQKSKGYEFSYPLDTYGFAPFKDNLGICGIRKDLVERLNRVKREVPEVEFVLSSTWRRVYGLDITEKTLLNAGFIGDLIDSTPTVYDLPVEQISGKVRGLEIQRWLDKEKNLYGTDITHIVILDDSDDMGHLLPNLVRTSMADGLQDAHVDEIVKRLKQGE